MCVPGGLSQERITVQVETGEGIEGAGYHGNTRDAAVATLHQPKQLHHTETCRQVGGILSQQQEIMRS